MVECGTFAQDAQDRDGLALVGFSSSSCGTPGLGDPQPEYLAPIVLGTAVCPGIGESALSRSTRMAHAVMPVQMRRLYVSGVQNFIAERCEGGPWTWAGGCSVDISRACYFCRLHLHVDRRWTCKKKCEVAEGRGTRAASVWSAIGASGRFQQRHIAEADCS